MINNIVKKYSARSNITKEVTPHTLRRTFLTFFYKRSKDLDSPTRISGHASVDTTRRYYSAVSDYAFKEDLYKFNY